MSPAWIMSESPASSIAVFEEAALGRAGGAAAVFVVGAAVAGAQEELRLREPADGAAEVGAVDGEDLELPVGDAAHPAGDLRGVAVVEAGDRAAEVGEASFADGEVVDAAEGDPGSGVGAFFSAGPSR